MDQVADRVVVNRADTFRQLLARLVVAEALFQRNRHRGAKGLGFENQPLAQLGRALGSQFGRENQRRGLPNVGIGDNSVIDNAILDKDARVGANVRLCNKDKVQNAEGPNFVIRDGVIVIPRSAIVLDGTVI